eukprot:GHRR01008954.1.p1 GENE.GHRR01008954.1~~GHRR01008954.1.p1  ORF type:complete len:964 (+),score=482.48 GHRR01008954.1:440-3331(+)
MVVLFQTTHGGEHAVSWSELPLPALKAIGRALDINSCLSARLTCSSWCEGLSASISSVTLLPAIVAKHGRQPIINCLSRLAHLEHIEVALASKVQAAHTRGYTAEHLEQLLSTLAQHCPQKQLPALCTYNETLDGRSGPGLLALPSHWRKGFSSGLASLGPKLTSLRMSDPTLLQPTLLQELSKLEFLELNLHKALEVSWQELAQLPELHSLMVTPPISPSSSGQGPEHVQQVVPTLLSFSIPAKDLLTGFTAVEGAAARMKQLLLQQTSSWNVEAAELLQQFTGLQALRLFPGPATPEGLWHDLAPVSMLNKLKELQLVGYSPISFSNGAAAGESLSAALPSLKTLELVIEPESDQVAAVAALTQLTRLKVMLQPRSATEAMQGAAAAAGEGLNGLNEMPILGDLQGLVINFAGEMQQQAQQVAGQLQQQQGVQQPVGAAQEMQGLLQQVQQQLQQLQGQQQHQEGGQQLAQPQNFNALNQIMGFAGELAQAVPAAAAGNAAGAGQAAAAAPPGPVQAAARAAAAGAAAAGSGGGSSSSTNSAQRQQLSNNNSSDSRNVRIHSREQERSAANAAASSSGASTSGASSGACVTGHARPKGLGGASLRAAAAAQRQAVAASRVAAAATGEAPAAARASSNDKDVSSFALADIPDVLLSSDDEQDTAAAAASGTSSSVVHNAAVVTGALVQQQTVQSQPIGEQDAKGRNQAAAAAECLSNSMPSLEPSVSISSELADHPALVLGSQTGSTAAPALHTTDSRQPPATTGASSSTESVTATCRPLALATAGSAASEDSILLLDNPSTSSDSDILGEPASASNSSSPRQQQGVSSGQRTAAEPDAAAASSSTATAGRVTDSGAASSSNGNESIVAGGATDSGVSPATSMGSDSNGGSSSSDEDEVGADAANAAAAAGGHATQGRRAPAEKGGQSRLLLGLLYGTLSGGSSRREEGGPSSKRSKRDGAH